jgi:hypothetical protein
MKYKHRDIKIFKTDVPTLETKNILMLSNSMYKEVYDYKDFKKIKNETMDKPKNIFQEYNKETYKIYKEVSKLLKIACEYYSIDQNRQNYFIKGRVFEYTENNNNEIFDFPGRDVPVFHGFVILGPESLKQTYYTTKSTQDHIFSKNTITLSSPTNLINSKVVSSCYVLEYYLSPLSSVIQNEQNLWIPIL